MKTFKTFITLLLLTIGMAAQAQQKVVIELNDGTSEAYDLADVDSVTYEPKEVVKYYFYAGWELPTSKEELVKLAKEPNGGEFTSLTGLDNTKNYYPNTLIGTRAKWYLVIPSTLKAYDYVSGGLFTDNDMNMIKHSEIGNYTVWESVNPSKYIENLKIY